jgi:ATP-binding cassette subfamily B protein
VIGSSLSIALRNALLLVGGLVMLFTTSLKLSLLTVGGVPLVVTPIIIFGRRVRALARASQARWPSWASASTRRSTRSASSRPTATRRRPAGLRRAGRAELRHRPPARGQPGAAGGLRAGAGVRGDRLHPVGRRHDVLAGELSAGQLSAFVFYAAIVAGSVGALSEVWGDLQRATGATERLMEILATRPAIQAPARPAAARTGARGDRFERVSFRYPARPDTAALADFDLRWRPARRWPWWGRPAPARARSSSSCCASTTRRPG